VSGRGRGDQPDIAHPWLAVEVKDRATLPAWLLDALDQAEKSATPAQLPVAVLHRAGDRHDHALVVLHLADCVAWFGTTQGVPCGKVLMTCALVKNNEKSC
jgi:hypothetical protein